MATNLKELMTELGFVPLNEGYPATWTLGGGADEVLVGQLSDGEIHITKSNGGVVPLVVRLNRYDEGLEGLLRHWLTLATR